MNETEDKIVDAQAPLMEKDDVAENEQQGLKE